MSNIDDIFNSFKTEMDSRAFIEAQLKMIMELTKKNQQLEQKVSHLESLLQKNVPLVVENSHSLIIAGGIQTEHEETICRIELKRLHDVSVGRALTYEETKQVDIYTKLLIQLNSNPKTIEREAKTKDTTELLALVEDINESNK